MRLDRNTVDQDLDTAEERAAHDDVGSGRPGDAKWQIHAYLQGSWVPRCSRRTSSCTGWYGPSPAGRPGRPVDSSPMPTFKAPAARATCCPPRRPTWTRLERLAADLATRYGYRPHRDAAVRADRRLRARRRRGHRRRREGAVPDRAAHRGGANRWALRPEPTAGIVRAYVQHGMQTLAAAGEGCTRSGRCSATTGRRPGAIGSSGSSTSRRSATPGPAVDAEIIELGVALLPRGRARPASRCSSTRSATRPADRRTSPS